MRIAFIGFGEAARAFRESLSEADPGLTFAAWDIAGTAAMAAAMDAHGVARAEGPAEAARGALWVISAVTADQSLAAAQSVAPHLKPGQVLIDMNSVSPGRKRETAALVTRSGAGYLDMAVMAPVLPGGHRVPVLVAGEGADALAPMLARLGFDFGVVGGAPGEATAVKMVRSVFVKGLEAITVETLLAAAAAGCLDRVLASLGKSFPGLGWPDNASYTFERTLRHGARRAAEMRESAATLDALGLHGALAAEIAAIQERMGALEASALADAPLAEAIAAIARARIEAGPPSKARIKV